MNFNVNPVGPQPSVRQTKASNDGGSSGNSGYFANDSGKKEDKGKEKSIFKETEKTENNSDDLKLAPEDELNWDNIWEGIKQFFSKLFKIN